MSWELCSTISFRKGNFCEQQEQQQALKCLWLQLLLIYNVVNCHSRSVREIPNQEQVIQLVLLLLYCIYLIF